MTRRTWIVPLVGVVVILIAALTTLGVLGASFNAASSDPFARFDRWPDDLVQMNSEAEAIVASAKLTLGGRFLNNGALGVTSWCGGNTAAATGWGKLGLLTMPEPGDPLPVALQELWQQWSDAGHSPTQPTWSAYLGTPGTRRVYTATTPDGTTLQVNVEPIDQKLFRDGPWSPSAVQIKYEYMTTCVEF